MSRSYSLLISSVLFGAALSSGIAYGSTSSASSRATKGSSATTAANVPKPEAAPLAGGDVTMTYSGSALASSDEDRVSSLDLELTSWVALGKDYRADGYLDLARDLNNYQETRVADARLGFLHNPIPIDRIWKYRPKLTVYLPVDPDKREVQSFMGAAAVANRFSFEQGIFSGYYQLALTKNFYRYETAGDSGASNPSWALGNVLKGGVTVQKFYFVISGEVSQRWTFENNPTAAFEVAEEAGMSFTPKFAVGIGHSNGDSLYQANGSDSNFSFANGNTSKYYLTGNYTF